MSQHFSRRNALISLIFCLFLPSVAHAGFLERIFAPKAELWSRWTAHAPADSRTIDHNAWESFLEQYTSEGADGVVRVTYGAVRDTDRSSLHEYVESLASTQISGYSRAEQFAYWVNLYNAQTVLIVLEHYPVTSIRNIDISPGLFADGPWRKKVLEIEGESVSLDDIEHRILRPIWKDARIHYAVNCASIGCPNLQRIAFTAENTKRLLHQSAKAYINHPRGVRAVDGELTLSSIYSWFKPDFEQEGGVLAHLRRFASPQLVTALAAFDRPSQFAYDWKLNDLASFGS